MWGVNGCVSKPPCLKSKSADMLLPELSEWGTEACPDESTTSSQLRDIFLLKLIHTQVQKIQESKHW